MDQMQSLLALLAGVKGRPPVAAPSISQPSLSSRMTTAPSIATPSIATPQIAAPTMQQMPPSRQIDAFDSRRDDSWDSGDPDLDERNKDKDKDKDEDGDDKVKMSLLQAQMQDAIDSGPGGYSKTLRQNLGMNEPTVGYGGKMKTSGMVQQKFMDLFSPQRRGNRNNVDPYNPPKKGRN